MTTTTPNHYSSSAPVPATESASSPVTFVVLAAWLAVVLVAEAAGAFATAPDDLPLGLLIGVAAPVVVSVLAYLAFARFRAFVLGLDFGLLTALQAWRVVGIGFLFLYAWDVLPGIFAYPAGLGDLAIGLAAPFLVAGLYTRGVPRRTLIVWNWAGLVDFTIAVATGLLASDTALGVLAGSVTSAPMNVLPLVLIPTFGVPVFILIHGAALLQLRQTTVAAEPVVRLRRTT